MARVAPRIPAAEDLLCERCGYVLNGLPETSRCPECGTPIVDSLGLQRTPPAWEANTAARPWRRFWATTSAVIFAPTRFYRTFNTRGALPTARRFAQVHWLVASGAFAVAAVVHGAWSPLTGLLPPLATSLPLSPRGWIGYVIVNWRLFSTLTVVTIVMAGCTYLALDAITRIAARLSAWEASYRGMRLPRGVVLRGLYFHAAHYGPVALLAAVTVLGYQVLIGVSWLSPASGVRYLYVLCIEVVLSAGYLFHTYWIGMRNMMYANR